MQKRSERGRLLSLTQTKRETRYTERNMMSGVFTATTVRGEQRVRANTAEQAAKKVRVNGFYYACLLHFIMHVVWLWLCVHGCVLVFEDGCANSGGVVCQ